MHIISRYWSLPGFLKIAFPSWSHLCLANSLGPLIFPVYNLVGFPDILIRLTINRLEQARVPASRFLTHWICYLWPLLRRSRCAQSYA